MANKLVKNGNVDFELVISGGTQISIMISTDQGEELVVRLLGQIIRSFQKSFNIYAPMDDEQIAETSIQLINDFWAYKLEDFVAFFQAARKGYYGEIKNRLDEQTILAMLARYDKERTKHLEDKQLALKTLELPGGDPRKADELGRGLDGLAGALAHLKGENKKEMDAIKKISPDGK